METQSSLATWEHLGEALVGGCDNDTSSDQPKATDERQSANEPPTSGERSGRETPFVGAAWDHARSFTHVDPDSDVDDPSDDVACLARGGGERSGSGTPVAEETAPVSTQAGQGAEPESGDKPLLGMGQLVSGHAMPLTGDVRGSTSEEGHEANVELSPVTEQSTEDSSSSSPLIEESQEVMPDAEEPDDDDDLWHDLLLDMGEPRIQIELDDDGRSKSTTPIFEGDWDADGATQAAQQILLQPISPQLIPPQRPSTPRPSTPRPSTSLSPPE